MRKDMLGAKAHESQPQEKIVHLGTNAVIDQMKVVTFTPQRKCAGSWQDLISQATPIINKLVEIAGKTPPERHFGPDERL